MDRLEQVPLPSEKSRDSIIHRHKTRVASVELFVRKTMLAALTMLGIGYVLVNATTALLVANSISAIPIASQANINALASRILFLIAFVISSLLGGLLIFGAVQFYENRPTRGIILLGVLLGSFYLMSLGVASTLLISQVSINALLLIVSPILVAISATTYASFNIRLRLAGSILGCIGGCTLAYTILSFPLLNQLFGWDIPFTGPFMSLTIVESTVMVLAPIAASVNSICEDRAEERPLVHLSILLIALVYGIGAFVGSLVLSMSFWNLIWKSPWLGPLYGLSEWILSTVVFWSASLVLIDIAGILLMISACLGFTWVAHEFAEF